jgi:hypothetical protein
MDVHALEQRLASYARSLADQATEDKSITMRSGETLQGIAVDGKEEGTTQMNREMTPLPVGVTAARSGSVSGVSEWRRSDHFSDVGEIRASGVAVFCPKVAGVRHPLRDYPVADGRRASEWVDDIHRNRWSAWTGLCNQNVPLAGGSKSGIAQ